MARRAGRSQEQWEQIGREAILDLLTDRRVAPWAEVEGRITYGWKEFPKVQPLQLSGARTSLRRDGLLEEDHSNHHPPVTTVRLPIGEGQKREIQRLTGRKRKMYRKYLAWAGDQDLCGKHGERVVMASLQASSTDGGLWVPKQTLGEVDEVEGVQVQPGPFDAYAHVLNLEAQPIHSEVPMVIEVKNVRAWLYPNQSEIWELLVRAAHLASYISILPVLACMRAAYSTFQMAKDIGFFACELREQVFSSRISDREFQTVKEEFGLPIQRIDGPVDSARTFFSRTLRITPAPTPSAEQGGPWYRQQVDRFSAIAPLVLRHASLAGVLGPATRRKEFATFRSEISDAADWELVGGW